MADVLKVANACAFWGDQPDAAARLVAQQPDLDFVTFDYLAEVSLSILAIMRSKDPNAAYARDFLDVLRSLAPFWLAGGTTRIVTNAGGLDPLACGRAAREILDAARLRRLRIAVVTGDDVLPALLSPRRTPADDRIAPSFANLETGAPLSQIQDRLVTANAYLGARGIVAALQEGADIVITGRVADPSLTVGPAAHHFGWTGSDYDRIAGATVAGHLIECGTQVTGGFSTDWLDLPPDPGFPIAEIEPDGTCTVTKPKGSGGAVTLDTVKEQLLYEIGDPASYLSPDATVSFLPLSIEAAGANRVRISGAAGRPPPPTLKVSATYRDGYRAHGILTVFGHNAETKARRAGNTLLRKLIDGGCVYRETLVECLGRGGAVPGVVAPQAAEPALETVLRVSVAAESREPVERFTREIAPLVTSGPQGVTGYAAGRPKILPIFGYWPCLIDAAAVAPAMQLITS